VYGTAVSGPSDGGRRGLGAFLGSLTVAWITAGILTLTVVGLAVALAATHPGSARVARPFARAGAFGGGFAGGRVGRPFGTSGVVGRVTAVRSGSFTVDARSGQTVTVDEQPSTSYYKVATSSSSSAVTNGVQVLVQGSRTGETVQATRVVVLPAGSFTFGGASPDAGGAAGLPPSAPAA
jgi:hypothetical protein